MEKNLKKIVLLFVAVASAVSVKAANYDQADGADTEMTSYDDVAFPSGFQESEYQQGDGTYQMPDADAMPVDGLQDGDAKYAGSFNEVADYADDQSNNDADMYQGVDRPDEPMTDLDQKMASGYYDGFSGDNEYAPENDSSYADETTFMTDGLEEAGIENYEQPTE